LSLAVGSTLFLVAIPQVIKWIVDSVIGAGRSDLLLWGVAASVADPEAINFVGGGERAGCGRIDSWVVRRRALAAGNDRGAGGDILRGDIRADWFNDRLHHRHEPLAQSRAARLAADRA